MVNLFNIDCYDFFKKIPNKSIDLILSDPPFNTTNNSWDDKIDIPLLWNEYKRIIKDNGAIILFSQIPFNISLAKENMEMLRYEYIWQKTTPTGHLNAKKMPMKAHENIMVFYKHLPTYNPQKTYNNTPTHSFIHKKEGSSNYGKQKSGIAGGGDTSRYPIDIQIFKSDKQKINIHPTQKPVALCEFLIKTYTNENDVVFDNFMGSGAIGVAAKKLNRNFLGIEREKKYFDAAKKWIDSTYIQEELFK